jgi:hypothetical protein
MAYSFRLMVLKVKGKSADRDSSFLWRVVANLVVRLLLVFIHVRNIDFAVLTLAIGRLRTGP